MGTTKVLLDTTVQIERHFYPLNRQRRVEDSLAGREVYMSSTTYREFEGSILSAFDFVIASLREIDPDVDLEEVSLRLSEVVRHVATTPMYSSRVAQRVQLVVALVADSIGPTDEATAADVVDLLEGERRRLRDWRFFVVGYWPNDYDVRLKGQYLDPCSCQVATDPMDPTTASPRRMSCNRERRQCRAAEFLDGSQRLAESAAEAVSVRKPAVPSVLRKSIELSQSGLYASLGEKLCWPLGDTFIGLEAKMSGSSIYSRDADQQLIAEALEIPLFEEP